MAYLITHVRIFDGERVTLEDAHVLLENGRIASISSNIPPVLPEGCVQIPGSGCTLLPGLIDSHVHVYNDATFLCNALRFGVTTVLDMHNEPHWFQEMKQLAVARDDVADILSACYAATVKDGWPAAIIQLTADSPQVRDRLAQWPDVVDVASAETFVVRNIESGASFIKLMQESGLPFDLPFPSVPVPAPSSQVQMAIVDIAHRHGMLTVGHALSFNDTAALLEAGVDGLAHACCQALSEQELSFFLERETKPFVIPTLAVQASAGAEEMESRKLYSQRLGAEHDRAHMCECLGIARKGFTMENAAANVRLFKKAGMEIVCGTDSSSHLKGVFVGASLHHELWLYVNRCGFTPLEALQSATSVPARIFKLHDRGRVATGLKADLVLVKGDPTTDIECTQNISEVWRNGIRLDMR
ncbi:hypothetical protein ASPCAL02420 [Aspergillus calidoustus]|uniref:Amidohydrolase-related domain-containing protein n=1 Tax=Aspergillus calidoustus TaxID=454130 RepID=A0A0U5GMV4_ASPCI|nr:hypothetical protein ASPCAL02420 [Aspergillus calidoustus]